MRIARGEKAISYRKARIILDRAQQVRQCRIEAPAEEMRCAQYKESRVHFVERAEPQRCIDMLNGEIRLVRPQPEEGADPPSACVVRVECQCAIHQRRHRADVLAERGQHQGGICQNFRVVAACIEGPPGKIDALQPIGRRVIASAVDDQSVTA